MPRDPRSSPTPRVGPHVDDEFYGDEPVGRPKGLDPFAARADDSSAEGEAALELLPKMTRATGSYEAAVRPKPRWAIALVTAAIVIALGVVVMLVSR
jgi:hypothetical protein